MQIGYSKNFKKQYKKLPKNVRAKFSERLNLYCENNKHPLLNIHKLSGKYNGLLSMNITGDIRGVFDKVGKSKIDFVAIGTHSELYS